MRIQLPHENFSPWNETYADIRPYFYMSSKSDLSFREILFIKNIGIKLNRGVRKETYFTNNSCIVFDVLPNVVEQC